MNVNNPLQDYKPNTFSHSADFEQCLLEVVQCKYLMNVNDALLAIAQTLNSVYLKLFSVNI